MIKVEKDPDALLDYTIDWSQWLVTGRSIASVTWIVPSGMTNEQESFTTTHATVWLSGGTLGQDYDVVCRVTDDATPVARIDDETLRVRIRQK